MNDSILATITEPVTRNASREGNGSLPIVLVPGLFCTARLYEPQINPLWKFGPVTIADHTRDDSMLAIARRLLANAPPRFALAGLSMGGYVSLEVFRQAPERVAKLALLDTSARPDAPEQTESRRKQIELALGGKLGMVVEMALPTLIHRDESVRAIVRQMAAETGAEAFARQQKAIMGRADSRPLLATIRCPTIIIVGADDRLIPPDRSKEMADGIAGSRLVTIPDCGHLATLEQPQQVTKALVDWLQG
ncbi:MAG TPA: alpha/beta fold hydrolase [Steroidobacteraceae bacterium]|nr:alpha/beta fold hydrolase [Steroidobacteraceae bacterium]